MLRIGLLVVGGEKLGASFSHLRYSLHLIYSTPINHTHHPPPSILRNPYYRSFPPRHSLMQTTTTPANLQRRKVAVLGSRSVGKSTLIVRFIENVFVDSYYPTIEATFTKTIKHKGKAYDCDIIDTAGQDEYSILNSKHAIGIHGYVLVYSIASRTSFEMIQTVYDKILNYMGTESVPCVIVGQKSDLHVQRQVSEEEGKELASQLKCAWVETSARHNVNVEKVFDLILGETERDTVEGGPEPPASKCVVM